MNEMILSKWVLFGLNMYHAIVPLIFVVLIGCVIVILSNADEKIFRKARLIAIIAIVLLAILPNEMTLQKMIAAYYTTPENVAKFPSYEDFYAEVANELKAMHNQCMFSK